MTWHNYKDDFSPPRNALASTIAKQLLQNNAAVALIGPRQIGKTTLALEVSKTLDAVYRDLENPREQAQVKDIELFHQQYPDQLIILDEVQRTPEIFAPLRGIIDKRRRAGQRSGQFLFLGSASLELFSQTSESLAGRIAYAELSGLDVLEISGAGVEMMDDFLLWIRGGFPESLMAADNTVSLMSHPVLGNSWEGFVLENLIDENSEHHYRPYFYRTQSGAEIDLVLERGGSRK